MIPYDIDPSLHASPPEQLLLDDGFSSPSSHAETPDLPVTHSLASLEEALASKSDF